jgi:DNA invertase Pin-like site-specific DNA recombinase
MKIGYLRVSTEAQKEDRQEDGLKALCDEIYVEKISGASKKRPVYQEVIGKLQPGDALVVWDLDRAFRSTVDALLEAEKLRHRGIAFQIVNLNVDTATPSGELIYTVMAAFAQFERQTLIRRTKEGMEAARRRGVHIGRPYKLTMEEVILAHSRIVSSQSTLSEMADQFGCSRETLAQGLRRLVLNETVT